jgi:hypothetical protein
MAQTSNNCEENKPESPVEDRNAAGETRSVADSGSSSAASKQEARLKRLGELRMRLVSYNWISYIFSPNVKLFLILRTRPGNGTTPNLLRKIDETKLPQILREGNGELSGN